MGAERVAADLWSIPVGIPDSPLRYTLCYVLMTGVDVVVIDPGWNADASWAELSSGLRETGVEPADVTGVVLTHVHPDHHGLSGRLRDVSGAWIAMHPAERETLGGPVEEAPRRYRMLAHWFAQLGAPEEELARFAGEFGERSRRGGGMLGLAEPDVLLEDRAELPLKGRRTVRVIWTPGHTPGHVCLHDEATGTMLTGDHVLPRITPNVGLTPGGPDDPVADYLASLAKVADYDVGEVLPGHERRFTGLAERTAAIVAHHDARTLEVLAVVAASRPWEQIGLMRFSALAETAAHVRHLTRRGRLHWTGDGPVSLPA